MHIGKTLNDIFTHAVYRSIIVKAKAFFWYINESFEVILVYHLNGSFFTHAYKFREFKFMFIPKPNLEYPSRIISCTDKLIILCILALFTESCI